MNPAEQPRFLGPDDAEIAVALVPGAGERQPRAPVRRPSRIEPTAPRRQVGQVLFRQWTVLPLGRLLPIQGQDRQVAGAFATDCAQQVEILLAVS